MQDLGISVLFMGNNFLRLVKGLWITIEIALISVFLSLILGIFLGILMESKNMFIRFICKIYLELIRILPQLVLLFLAYFGLTKAFGINLSGKGAAILVFTLWGSAEMGDLVRGALSSIAKHQYESGLAIGLKKNSSLYLHYYSTDGSTFTSFSYKFNNKND